MYRAFSIGSYLRSSIKVGKVCVNIQPGHSVWARRLGIGMVNKIERKFVNVDIAVLGYIRIKEKENRWRITLASKGNSNMWNLRGFTVVPGYNKEIIEKFGKM